MPRCSICLKERRTLRFRTGRLSICDTCVKSLNETPLSARQAEAQWFARLRERVVRNRPDSLDWVDDWLARSREWIAAQDMDDPKRVGKSHELKVMRAYRAGLVCLDRKQLAYPPNWDFKRFRVKHWDRYSCHDCHVLETPGAALHVHHIVFRSNSGSNSYRNLVTLCSTHHQAMHDHLICEEGGDHAALQADDTPEEGDAPPDDFGSTGLPEEFDQGAYQAALPTFNLAMERFRSNGRTARELFVFLIQTFGRNVGRYALHFAKEQRERGHWF